VKHLKYELGADADDVLRFVDDQVLEAAHELKQIGLPLPEELDDTLDAHVIGSVTQSPGQRVIIEADAKVPRVGVDRGDSNAPRLIASHCVRNDSVAKLGHSGPRETHEEDA
jgi:hypothetical protein